jgi:hypothetical protein
MKLLDKLAVLDRRIIYLCVGIAVIIPMLVPLNLPVDITRPVRNVFNKIESLPEGSVILVSTDYDPGSEAELYPATEAVIEHCFRRNLKIYMMGLWPAGSALGEHALDTIALVHNKHYGTDFVNAGYRPGGAVMLLSLGRNFNDVIRVDYAGRPIDSLELGRRVKSSKDIALVMTLSAGDPGVIHWVQYFHARFGTPICAATTAIMAPREYPYMNSGQLVGLLGGLKGAAEYETLVHRKGRGLTGMDSQSIVHVLLVLFIILGNVILVYQRRKKSAGGAG